MPIYFHGLDVREVQAIDGHINPDIGTPLLVKPAGCQGEEKKPDQPFESVSLRKHPILLKVAKEENLMLCPALMRFSGRRG